MRDGMAMPAADRRDSFRGRRVLLFRLNPFFARHSIPRTIVDRSRCGANWSSGPTAASEYFLRLIVSLFSSRIYIFSFSFLFLCFMSMQRACIFGLYFGKRGYRFAQLCRLRRKRGKNPKGEGAFPLA